MGDDISSETKSQNSQTLFASNTLLAYNRVHQIRRCLKEKDIHDSWATVRSTLSTQTRTTVTLQTSSQEQIHIRKSSYPEDAQQRILRALGLSWIPAKKLPE